MELEDLKAKTEEFINLVFDHVGHLNQESLLGHLYKFEQAIEDKING